MKKVLLAFAMTWCFGLCGTAHAQPPATQAQPAAPPAVASPTGSLRRCCCRVTFSAAWSAASADAILACRFSVRLPTFSVTVGGGAVKVKNEVRVEFEIVAK